MTDRVVIEGVGSFIGKHCETTALKRVLDYHGLSISEEMLLGLGGGIGFIYWYSKNMPAPFVGARNGKVGDFLKSACQRIGADAIVFETSSPKRGYEELKAILRDGEPAVVYGDMAYLPYFAIPEVGHFGGHVFVVSGLDEARDEVYIYDRSIKPLTVNIADLEKARGSKYPPFPPKYRLLKIKHPPKIIGLENGIREAIGECCQNMMGPPIRNIGLAGIVKWSQEVVKWPGQFKEIGLLGVLMNSFIYIETGGTGGSAFRPMYTQFLEEASLITGQPALKEAADTVRKSAAVWSEVASGFLPDSCPNLKRIRELTLEKNELFEKQAPGTPETMTRLNSEMDNLMEPAVTELRNAPDFLRDVQRNIERCFQIEKEAFQILSNTWMEN